MKTVKNRTSRYTGKNRYKVIHGDYALKYNSPRSFYVMDGKLEQGWRINHLKKLDSETFKTFKEASKHFKDKTGVTPPKPVFV